MFAIRERACERSIVNRCLSVLVLQRRLLLPDQGWTEGTASPGPTGPLGPERGTGTKRWLRGRRQNLVESPLCTCPSFPPPPEDQLPRQGISISISSVSPLKSTAVSAQFFARKT